MSWFQASSTRRWLRQPETQMPIPHEYASSTPARDAAWSRLSPDCTWTSQPLRCSTKAQLFVQPTRAATRGQLALAATLRPGQPLHYGIVKDVLIAATYERGENRNRKYLLGPAVDLDLPGFDRFSLNTYYRKPDGITGKASGQWQINPTWAMTFPVGRSDILFDGYLEWYVNDVGSKGTSNYVAKSLHFNPQFKYDVGKALGQTAKRFYAGVEWDYWSDKYGIEDSPGFPTDQNAVSVLVKVHF